jgi:hypothetical protein
VPVVVLTEPSLHTEDPASCKISVRVYGDSPALTALCEDDGGWIPSLPEVKLAWDSASRKGVVSRSASPGGVRYQIVGWEQFTGA